MDGYLDKLWKRNITIQSHTREDSMTTIPISKKQNYIIENEKTAPPS